MKRQIITLVALLAIATGVNAQGWVDVIRRGSEDAARRAARIEREVERAVDDAIEENRRTKDRNNDDADVDDEEAQENDDDTRHFPEPF